MEQETILYPGNPSAETCRFRETIMLQMVVKWNFHVTMHVCFFMLNHLTELDDKTGRSENI